MKKNVTFNSEAKEKLKKGIDTVADAVKSTLGASGRLVIFQDFYNNVQVTKDGYSVAKSIELLDSIEDCGAQLIRQVADKTVKSAGDGTTTSCVLAQAIINKGLEEIEKGKSPVEVANEIKSSTKQTIENIRKQSIDIKGNWDKIKQVATISANGDEKHAHMIVDAMKQVGENGVIIIEQGKEVETKINIVNGLEFDSGYLSPFFVNTNKNECILENPIICITTETISYLKDQILPVLTFATEKQTPVLFICNNSDGEGFASLIVNKTKGNFPLCAVNAPQRYKGHEATIDVAILTGGNVLGSEFGKEIKLSKETDFGRAEKVIITKDKTLIIGGKGDKKKIDERIESIKSSIEKEENDIEKEDLKKRLAKLSGGIAIINVGGISEASIRELKDRMDDAHCATKCAIEEGIVLGGGIAYLNETFRVASQGSILSEVLRSPFKQILQNAGLDYEKYIKEFSTAKIDYNGVNVRNDKIENFHESGIIDATKVVISALENASDIACLFLTSNVVITNLPNEKK